MITLSYPSKGYPLIHQLGVAYTNCSWSSLESLCGELFETRGIGLTIDNGWPGCTVLSLEICSLLLGEDPWVGGMPLVLTYVLVFLLIGRGDILEKDAPLDLGDSDADVLRPLLI
mmetsp:Transcript_7193/g.7290  ORF Transcript_7193/g.7290 Transcript_7193/m.7290 type:complete len:115 (+) Transcript_7193:345-689(+)